MNCILTVMPRHRRTNREIEVKLRVADVPGMLRKLENLGAPYYLVARAGGKSVYSNRPVPGAASN